MFGSATVGAVTDGELDRRTGVLFCRIDQIKCDALVVAVAGEDLGSGNTLRFHIDGDGSLVAVEAVSHALASVAFFRIMDRDNPVGCFWPTSGPGLIRGQDPPLSLLR
jgi:hypothetical protein